MICLIAMADAFTYIFKSFNCEYINFTQARALLFTSELLLGAARHRPVAIEVSIGQTGPKRAFLLAISYDYKITLI